MDRDLLGEYNQLWRRTRHFQAIRQTKPYMHNYKATPERLALMGRLRVWCDARAIDPKLWIWYLFDRRRWSFAPKLEATHLLAEKHLGEFRGYNFEAYRSYRQEVSDSTYAPLYDPNRDVTPAVEMDKARWLRQGTPDQCLSRIWQETLGYHPHSQVCGLCPVAAQCAQALQTGLPFDILALRRGEISSDVARMQHTARTARTAPNGHAQQW